MPGCSQATCSGRYKMSVWKTSLSLFTFVFDTFWTENRHYLFYFFPWKSFNRTPTVHIHSRCRGIIGKELFVNKCNYVRTLAVWDLRIHVHHLKVFLLCYIHTWWLSLTSWCNRYYNSEKNVTCTWGWKKLQHLSFDHVNLIKLNLTCFRGMYISQLTATGLK